MKKLKANIFIFLAIQLFSFDAAEAQTCDSMITGIKKEYLIKEYRQLKEKKWRCLDPNEIFDIATFLRQDQNPDYKTWYKKALKEYKKSAFGYEQQMYLKNIYHVALCYFYLNDFRNAEKWFLISLKANYPDPCQNYFYSLTLNKLGKKTEADEQFNIFNQGQSLAKSKIDKNMLTAFVNSFKRQGEKSFLEINFINKKENINGLSLSLLKAENKNLNGLGFGLIGTWNQNTNGLICGGLAGCSEKLNGIAFGGIYAGADQKLNGVSIGGLVSGATEKMNGISLGGLVSGAGEKLDGVSVGGIFSGSSTLNGVSIGGINYVGNMNGIGIGGIASIAVEMGLAEEMKQNGVLFSGLVSGFVDVDKMNVSTKVFFNGIQVSGLGIWAYEKLNGLCFAGAIIKSRHINGMAASGGYITGFNNSSENGERKKFVSDLKTKGFLIGLMGVNAESLSGVGIGGLLLKTAHSKGVLIGAIYLHSNEHSGFSMAAYNQTDYLKGVQLGVFNKSANSDSKGLQIGLINSALFCKGIQIGLINHIKNNPGFLRTLPFVNFHFKCPAVIYYDETGTGMKEINITYTVSYIGKDSLIEIKGKLMDDLNLESLPFAEITLLSNEVRVSNTQSDINGQFKITALYEKNKNYSVKVTYMGYHTKIINNIH